MTHRMDEATLGVGRSNLKRLHTHTHVTQHIGSHELTYIQECDILCDPRFHMTRVCTHVLNKASMCACMQNDREEACMYVYAAWTCMRVPKLCACVRVCARVPGLFALVMACVCVHTDFDVRVCCTLISCVRLFQLF